MVHGERKAKKSQALDPESFARLLRWLDKDPDRAGEKYVKIQKRLIEFFALRHCPEDLADETINRVARKVREKEAPATSSAAYFFRVAKFVALESYRNPERNLTPLDGPGADRLIAKQYPAPAPDDPIFECLDNCLAKLPPEERNLILAYYPAGDPMLKESGLLKRARERLRELLEMSERKMNSKTFRIRRRLKNCVEQCLAHSRTQQNL